MHEQSYLLKKSFPHQTITVKSVEQLKTQEILQIVIVRIRQSEKESNEAETQRKDGWGGNGVRIIAAGDLGLRPQGENKGANLV